MGSLKTQVLIPFKARMLSVDLRAFLPGGDCKGVFRMERFHSLGSKKMHPVNLW